MSPTSRLYVHVSTILYNSRRFSTFLYIQTAQLLAIVTTVIKQVQGDGADVNPQVQWLQSPVAYGSCVVVADEVSRARKKQMYPPSLLREAILLQYVADSRIDTVLQEMFSKMFWRPLLPNPYPSIVNLFAAAATRQDLWSATDGDVLEDLVESKTIDPVGTGDNSDAFHVHRSKDTSSRDTIFGQASALMFAHPGRLGELYR